ncbi:uncharacterized protein CTRU02_209802 [Colletotrichum truncatum]|uniref:Uncharacterized protein n=1 Tax=Colletotrichum truncatum TaxID=5467 RepID=A0ACC3YUR0_COLTU|nr:uncharacterized protein CTRU02_02374 [Colletotrichum truncatum]KAF6798400.1 hypothetical protein CTRU02_02374 [Colletotrichum truncatum]
MFSKNSGNWLDAFSSRRGSRSSISSSSSGSFSGPSRKTSRSASLASIFSRGTSEEEERLMVDEPVQRTPYVPRYAAKSYMKTTTTHEIRINSEIL